MSGQLTKCQRRFVEAVAAGSGENFHRSVIEPCERMGLVQYQDGLRLLGRNAFPANRFVLCVLPGDPA